MFNKPYKNAQQSLSQHESVLVLGSGVTGYSVVRFLRKAGVSVTVMDSRQQAPNIQEIRNNFPEVKIKIAEFDANYLAQFSLIVVSPGLNTKDKVFTIAREGGADIVGDIELFVRFNQKPIIAITGSNGKSTVTALVGELCLSSGVQALIAGNIGLPVLDALTDDIAYDIAVLELSSFQLETTQLVPAVAAAILNISEDHMDRYTSMGDYILAKARILRGAKNVILPRHEPLLEQITTQGVIHSFGLDEPNGENNYGVQRINSHRWLTKGREKIMRLNDVPLLGLHNVQNVQAAFALVESLGLEQKGMIKAVSEFSGLPHRMETVIKANGITWVNDSKATNVGATATALRSLENDVVLIAGGQSKGADFSDLRHAIHNKVKHAVLLGEDADLIAAIIPQGVPTARVANMQEAVSIAGDKAEQDSVVLLSPACASFDMYRSFEERGDDFKQCAKDWVEAQVA